MPTNGRKTEYPTLYDGSGRQIDFAALARERNNRIYNGEALIDRGENGYSGTVETYGDNDLPHPITFAALYRGASFTYLHQWDEAIKHSRVNALAMRRDCWLMALLNERVDDTMSKRWHLECDNPRDPWQKSVCDGITKILCHTPHLKKMMRYMLSGSLWYGRYGSNLRWIWDDMYVPVMQHSGPIVPGTVSEPQFEKRRILRIQKHKPINGDKIAFHYDDTPYVMINASWTDKLRGSPYIIYPTGAGSAALLLRGTWREQMFIAESDPDDSDFFEAEMAAGVHGVGIRSRIYWLDFMRRDYINWVTDSMERLGLGLVVIWYDASNADAKKEAFTVAKTYSRRAAICMPRSPDSSWQGGGIEVVEAPTAGAQIVLELQKHLEQMIERYILGQNLSSGNMDGRGSFGGSGGAEFASDTKRKKTQFDADDFAESMTGSECNPSPISVIKKWCYPFADFPVWMVFDHEYDDPAKKMEAIKTAVDMGVSFPEGRVRELTGIPSPVEGDEIIGGKQALAMEQMVNKATGGNIGGGMESGGLDSGAPEEDSPDKEKVMGASNDAPTEKFSYAQDLLKGGLADKKKPEDFDQEQLATGIKVEMEHTNDENIAREIAMDHLTEDKEYYKKLKKMESQKYAQELGEIDEQLWEKCKACIPEQKPTSLPHELGWIDKWRICLVDGNKVKIEHDPDFVEGNNYKESPEFIPEPEIWLDAAIETCQLPYILYHETHECRDMEGGMSYDEAHNRANAGEMILRKRGMGEHYATYSDFPTDAMSLQVIINRIRNQGTGYDILPRLREFLRRYPDLARQIGAADLAFINTRGQDGN